MQEKFYSTIEYIEYAGVAQLVEHYLAKVNVVGSNPITRSTGNGYD